MKRIEGPSFTIGPGDTERTERIIRGKEYRFIRLGDKFGFEEIRPTITTQRPRSHENLAKSTKLFKGRTQDGKYVVTDGGRMIAYADHIELAVDWTATTQIEAMIGFNMNQGDVSAKYDQIQLPIRKETAQKLADLLHRPVSMKYQPVSVGVRMQEFTFTPR